MARKPEVGHLDERIALRHTTFGTPSAAGQVSVTRAAAYATVWASIKPNLGSKNPEEMSQNATHTWLVTIRRRDDLKTYDSITYEARNGTRILYVISIADKSRSEFTVLTCAEDISNPPGAGP